MSKKYIKFQELIEENLNSEIESFSEDLEAYSASGCGGVPCTQNAGCKADRDI